MCVRLLQLHQLSSGRVLSRTEASSNASVRFRIRAATGTGLGLGCVCACNVVRTSETKDHPVLTGDSESDGKEWLKRHAKSLTPCISKRWNRKVNILHTFQAAKNPAGAALFEQFMMFLLFVRQNGKTVNGHDKSWYKVGNWFLLGLPTGVVPTQKGNGAINNLSERIHKGAVQTIGLTTKKCGAMTYQ